MQQFNGHMIKDNGFALFRQLLTYKTTLYGKQLSIISRYYSSSQICSNCGDKNKCPLSTRVDSCKCCGLEIDRDVNAAINRHWEGTAWFKPLGCNHVDKSLSTCIAIDEGSYGL